MFSFFLLEQDSSGRLYASNVNVVVNGRQVNPLWQEEIHSDSKKNTTSSATVADQGPTIADQGPVIEDQVSLPSQD